METEDELVESDPEAERDGEEVSVEESDPGRLTHPSTTTIPPA